MILGIGTDLTNIDRLAEVLARHEERFIERCFGAEERQKAESGDARQRAAGYAKRWAAKEACAKALGLGSKTGTLEAGKWADLAIWNIERPAELVYRMGFNPLHARVWKGAL